MLLGFKARFAPLVEDGSKTHTIRAERKNPPKAGEMCHCYTGLRRKGARLLGRWPCVKVEGIRIYDRGGTLGVVIDGHDLDRDECNALAWRDGFRGSGPKYAFAEMAAYWLALHPQADGPFVFAGHVIHWKYDNGKLPC